MAAGDEPSIPKRPALGIVTRAPRSTPSPTSKAFGKPRQSRIKVPGRSPIPSGRLDPFSQAGHVDHNPFKLNLGF